MATTAVVAGTATAVSGRVSRRQAGRAQQSADAEAYQQQQEYEQQMAYQQQAAAQAPPPPAAPAGGGLTDEDIAQLQQLASLKEQGVLTEEEFAAQKARILGG